MTTESKELLFNEISKTIPPFVLFENKELIETVITATESVTSKLRIDTTKFKSRREALDLSIDSVSEKVGISQSGIRSIEKGNNCLYNNVLALDTLYSNIENKTPSS